MDDRALLAVLKALGHAKRFRMVQEIAEAGELSCGQIASRIPVAQPTISHHLKILTDAGILVIRREGQHGFATVNREVIAEAVALLPDRLVPHPRRQTRRSRGRRRAPKPALR